MERAPDPTRPKAGCHPFVLPSRCRSLFFRGSAQKKRRMAGGKKNRQEHVSGDLGQRVDVLVLTIVFSFHRCCFQRRSLGGNQAGDAVFPQVSSVFTDRTNPRLSKHRMPTLSVCFSRTRKVQVGSGSKDITQEALAEEIQPQAALQATKNRTHL